MAHTTPDDAFHEIQLSGKQLIFLFMAATIVSVVIFLVGVMVGRGVRTERAAIAENEVLSASPTADVQPAATPLPPTAADLTVVPPPPTADEASEIRPGASADDKKSSSGAATPSQKLEKAAAAAREQKPPAPTPAPVSPPTPSTPPPTRAAVTPPASGTPNGATPTGSSGRGSDGWAVQVAAVKARGEADQYAKGLASKGYDAYVVSPQAGVSSYRVRVGSFKNKQDANALAEKIGKEMKLEPWVTR